MQHLLFLLLLASVDVVAEADGKHHRITVTDEPKASKVALCRAGEIAWFQGWDGARVALVSSEDGVYVLRIRAATADDTDGVYTTGELREQCEED